MSMNDFDRKPSAYGGQVINTDATVAVSAITTIKGSGRFSSAKFSADGLSIITTSSEGCQRWDALSGKFLADIPPDDSDCMTYHEFWEQEVNSLNVETEAEQRACDVFRGFAHFATTAPNGRLVAVGSHSGHLQLVDLDSAVPLILHGHITSMNNHAHQNSIEAMLFDSSSTYLISMSDEEDAPLLWDLSAKGEERIWNKKPALSLKPIRLRDFGISGIDTVHFSPSEPRFVATDRVEETAVIWEIVPLTTTQSET